MAKGKAKKTTAAAAAAATTTSATSSAVVPAAQQHNLDAPWPEETKKLAPVYELLDSGNFKQGLRSLAALIQKHGNRHMLLALQALAFELSGKRDEALVVQRQLQQLQPCESAVLTTMMMTWKKFDMAEEATVCYQNAVTKQPDNQELLQQLYFSLGRQFRHDKQQQVAMQLYKKFKQRDDVFLFWSALNMLVMHERQGASSMLQVRHVRSGCPSVRRLCCCFYF
jgi:tetratricopeptide (TPR) repeat protein